MKTNKSVKNYNNGQPLSIENEEKNWAQMAKDFSEGNKNLEELLLTAWRHGLKTYACCNGHLKDGICYDNYISFYTETDEQAINLATNLYIVMIKNSTAHISIGKDFLGTDICQTDNAYNEFIGQDPKDHIRRYVHIRFNFKTMLLKNKYYKLLSNTIKNCDMLKSYDNKEFRDCKEAITWINDKRDKTIVGNRESNRNKTFNINVPLEEKTISDIIKSLKNEKENFEK